MDEKINLQSIQEYSSAYALSVAGSVFSTKIKISGTDIINLCTTHQINLFVLRELLKAWEREVQKYKSPYFNYDNNEVKQALEHFQNILSNHIFIARDHFLPLLEKGVRLTVYLILNPYDFYSHMLNGYGKGSIEISQLKNELKYIKINRTPLEALIKKWEEKKLNSSSKQDAFMLFNKTLENVNFTPEEIDPYIDQLSKVVPLSVENLYTTQEGTSTETPFSDNIVDNTLSLPLQKKSATTVAEKYQKIYQLKEQLTLNQKFMFTKMLFNGDFNVFNTVITQIESLNSLAEATEYLDAHYPSWNHRSDEYKEFTELLTRYFLS